MITQDECNDVCDLMYSIRDSINDDDIGRSLELAKQLYDTLLMLAVTKDSMKCILYYKEDK